MAKPTFLDRIAYWLGKREPEPDAEAIASMNAWMANAIVPSPETVAEAQAAWFARERKRGEEAMREQLSYLHDFGPNVPVEDLGGKPCFYENGQPVYWEKGP
jgi:hypothetical protein